jgi:hypothetical protein
LPLHNRLARLATTPALSSCHAGGLFYFTPKGIAHTATIPSLSDKH